MTAAVVAATPQFRTARQLRAAIEADFVREGVDAVVEIGEWQPDAIGRGRPRVMITFADGIIGEPGGHYQPGLAVGVNSTPSSIGAVVATLDPSSTITHTTSGTPTASGSFVVRFTSTGTTGNADLFFALSVDAGATYENDVPLDIDTEITVYGVIVALGSGTVATLGDTLAWTQVAAGSQAARPILDWTKGYLLRVHAPAPAAVPTNGEAEAAQDATEQLAARVAIAVRRALGAPLPAPGMRTHWPKHLPDYPAFTYGSMCEIAFALAVPLLDDALGVGQALEIAIVGSAVYSDGSATPGETVTTPIV